jgi:hypothetical protein
VRQVSSEKEVIFIRGENEVARQHAIRMIDRPGEFKVTIEPIRKQRSSSQNNAIHEFCEQLAETLNAGGLEMKVVLEQMEVDIPWTKETVKECLWRKIQIPLTGKKSSARLNTGEVSKVYEVLSRHLSQKLSVYVEFPSREHNGV